MQTDPAGELHLVLPSAGGHLKKQPNSQTKLEADHLFHYQLWHEQYQRLTPKD